MGGELLFGWILFPSQEKNGGIVSTLTAATREQWPEFRNLWPLLWRIQHQFNQHLPEIANAQKAKAASAKESYLDYIFRVHFQEAGATYLPDRKGFRAALEQCEVENPEVRSCLQIPRSLLAEDPQRNAFQPALGNRAITTSANKSLNPD